MKNIIYNKKDFWHHLLLRVLVVKKHYLWYVSRSCKVFVVSITNCSPFFYLFFTRVFSTTLLCISRLALVREPSYFVPSIIVGID